VNIFKRGGGREIAEELDVPFLGGIPIDPEICVDSDDGKPFIDEASRITSLESLHGYREENRKVFGGAKSIYEPA
jgi:septum formation inhibitor-activating ATPase MinD